MVDILAAGQATDEPDWNGRPISQMTTSHIQNTIEFLRRRIIQANKMVGGEHSASDNWRAKIRELEAELQKESRKNENILVQRSDFRVTEHEVIKLAQRLGVKIPKTGAGVYFVTDDRTFRLDEGRLCVRFDVETPLQDRGPDQDQGRPVRRKKSNGRADKKPATRRRK